MFMTDSSPLLTPAGPTRPAETTVTLQSGQVIGHYELIEQIGRGGEATVWSAWDTALGQMTAFKALPRSTEEYATFQFGREVSLLRHLSHPHVLSILDYGELPGVRYLLSRYLSGGTLARRIPQSGGMAFAEVIRVGQHIAQALDYLHEERVVHRDLKPSNILFDLNNNAYLSDFGLARPLLAGSTAPVHSQSGTLIYMPPEQFMGSRLVPQSDYYSFGVTLFEMLTSTLPFAGEAVLAMRQINNDELLPDPCNFRGELPPAVTDLLRRMTAQEARNRPLSATTAIRELAAALDIPMVDTPPAVLMTRAEEARLLLDRVYQADRHILSATELVIINAARPEMTLSDADYSLLLKSALLYGREVETWWDSVPETTTRISIAWETWTQYASTAPRIITQMLTLPDNVIFQIHAGVLNTLSAYLQLQPSSDPAQRTRVLTLLERGTVAAKHWQPFGFSKALDSALATLALSTDLNAPRAALLIGKARSSSAVHTLIAAGVAAVPTQRLADVYETAHSLPSGTLLSAWLRMLGWLTARQLTRNPREVAVMFATSIVGAVLCMGSMVYLTFNDPDPLQSGRLLNTLGVGLLFGLLIGIGVAFTRLLSARLQLLPIVARLVLSSIIGCFIVGEAFNVYHTLYLSAEPRGSLILIGAIVWVAGFAIAEICKRTWQRSIISATGVFLALAGTWYASQIYKGRRPPDPLMFFDPNTVLPISLLAAFLAVAVLLLMKLFYKRPVMSTPGAAKIKTVKQNGNEYYG